MYDCRSTIQSVLNGKLKWMLVLRFLNQATITRTQQKATAASAVKEKLILDVVEAFMLANIPLDKLDNANMRSC